MGLTLLKFMEPRKEKEFEKSQAPDEGSRMQKESVSEKEKAHDLVLALLKLMEHRKEKELEKSDEPVEGNSIHEKKASDEEMAKEERRLREKREGKKPMKGK